MMKMMCRKGSKGVAADRSRDGNRRKRLLTGLALGRDT